MCERLIPHAWPAPDDKDSGSLETSRSSVQEIRGACRLILSPRPHPRIRMIFDDSLRIRGSASMMLWRAARRLSAGIRKLFTEVSHHALTVPDACRDQRQAVASRGPERFRQIV